MDMTMEPMMGSGWPLAWVLFLAVLVVGVVFLVRTLTSGSPVRVRPPPRHWKSSKRDSPVGRSTATSTRNRKGFGVVRLRASSRSRGMPPRPASGRAIAMRCDSETVHVCRQKGGPVKT
jgi:hypothetical protein